MPRARTTEGFPQSAAPHLEPGRGCLFGFILPPLSVLVISILLGNLVLTRTPWEHAPRASGVSPIFTSEVRHWADLIDHWANRTELDPNLIATVMQIESCGDPRAVSTAGAIGLFQVMPFHFQPLDDPFSPDVNALRGTAYLERAMAVAKGNVRLALAGYNGGIGVITREESSWSAQTRRYVQYGWPIYSEAREGLESSPSLMEWYRTYGASLCRQARQRLGLP